ncbi:hypothetical protein [Nocardia gamkensis]|uniref:Uncharacterized protein n=1 Tax=Nocardia gamkensis TaxID=352869 RepID=A0A7X6L0Z4_9NOCA|nr:hypothetical protein [Nocardia gamkensis]NKY25730.1 hypothetical protein [Nocardia gamkensis]NQE66407.1 hypothetical protein [Nocardia gamkensis]
MRQCWFRVLAGHEPGLLVRLVDGVVPHRIRQVPEASLRAGQRSGDIAADLDPSDTAIALEAIFTAVIITVVQVGGSGSSERIDAVARLVRTALTGKRPTWRVLRPPTCTRRWPRYATGEPAVGVAMAGRSSKSAPGIATTPC